MRPDECTIAALNLLIVMERRRTERRCSAVQCSAAVGSEILNRAYWLVESCRLFQSNDDFGLRVAVHRGKTDDALSIFPTFLCLLPFSWAQDVIVTINTRERPCTENGCVDAAISFCGQNGGCLIPLRGPSVLLLPCRSGTNPQTHIFRVSLIRLSTLTEGR